VKSFSLSELVQDTWQKFELRARQAGVHFAISLAHGPVLVEGDVGLIQRILDNLIDNAIKFTPSGGSVNVLLETALSRAIVEIRDTGIGVGQEHLPHIFEPFYSITSRAINAHSGAGLGLAIAWRIAELHHSKIEVESAPGEGTSFRFGLELIANTDRSVAVHDSYEPVP
jgi:two-component system, OmpR family, sensor kinase